MSANTTSFCTFVNRIDLEDEPIEDAYSTLFEMYEEVIIKALVTSFGLDFLMQKRLPDRHGGDVDTIHNVRQIGKDPEMTYKNQKNADDYANRGKYDASEYHAELRNREKTNYAKIVNQTKKDFENTGFSPTVDEYTGKKNLLHNKHALPDVKANLDHIIEAKAIHDDPGRVLANLDGRKLADAKENFAWTNEHLNKSMGSWANKQMQQWEKQCKEAKKSGFPLPPKPDVDMEAYINAYPELDETTKKNMLAHYKKAKKAYDAKINRVYYTSKKFWKDTGKAAAKLGLSMGLRQALGLVFTEIWFTVKDAIITCKKDGKSLFEEMQKP